MVADNSSVEFESKIRDLYLQAAFDDFTKGSKALNLVP